MARTNARDPEQFRVVAEVTRSYDPGRIREEVFGPYKTRATAQGVLTSMRNSGYTTVHDAKIQKSVPGWVTVETHA